ncbi:MAG: translation initiation factor IF-2 [Selenomonadaceae bacterium]|nr:translation initiation factor IF-2 [Selenomonadaceae bacterium]
MVQKEHLILPCAAAVWLFSSMPDASASPVAQSPAWIYASLTQLMNAGYLMPPEKPLSECSREELSQLVSQALYAIDRSGPVPSAEEYEQAVHRVDQYKSQPLPARVPGSEALKNYESAARQARVSTERFLRHSIQGNNRLEAMAPLKKRSDRALDHLESAARDYALEQGRARPAADPETTNALASGYGQLSRRIVIDEMQLKLSREQEFYARKMSRDAARHEKDTTDAKSRSFTTAREAVKEQASFTAQDYALARKRSYQRALRLSYEQARQESLLDSLMGKSSQEPAALSSTASDHAARLRAEFFSELADSGYLDDADARLQLSSNVPVKDDLGQRFQLNGEIRLDYGHYTGADNLSNRTRIRIRLFPDYNLDGNWHLKAMVEWEKALSGPKGSEDGHLRLDRYYLSGNMGVVHTDIGAFGSLMAEGNIFDSRFNGIRLSAGDPVRYTVEYGNLNKRGTKRAYDVTATYDTADYGVDAGYYHFDHKNGNSQNIYMANYRQRLGLFDAGLMLLHGRKSDGSGTGFVFSLGYTPEDSWRPKSFSYWLKYYRQPSSTYISHTMSGTADILLPYGGFRGWGLGCDYNLTRDWNLGLEFYHLQDLSRGHTSNTFWSRATRNFNNYEDYALSDEDEE